MSIDNSPALNEQVREEIAAKTHLIQTEYAKRLAPFVENLPSPLSVILAPKTGGLPPPPRQPIMISRILADYAIELYNMGLSYFPLQSDQLGAWKQSLVREVEERMLAHLLRIGRLGFGPTALAGPGLRYHISEEEMRQVIRSELNARIERETSTFGPRHKEQPHAEQTVSFILPSGAEEVTREERIPAVAPGNGVQTEAKSREASRASEPGKSVVSQTGDDESMAGQRKPPRRKPNFELSRERLDLVKRLACELATLKQDVKGFCTPEELRRRHPEFVAWKCLSTDEVKQIAAGEAFSPKAYAESIALRQFGLTSRETLKKDRSKLRKSHNR